MKKKQLKRIANNVRILRKLKYGNVFDKLINESTLVTQHNKLIECNNRNIHLSIQASSYLYCIPRINCNDNDIYTHFEIGVRNQNGYLVCLDSPYYGGDNVGGYVPRDVIQDIYLKLCAKGLKK